MNTWTTTRTGLTFHSFSSDGTAICRSSIKAAGGLITETQVDESLAEARRARVRGMKKCDTCATKEAAFRDRLETSMAPSTGEGDHLAPAEADWDAVADALNTPVVMDALHAEAAAEMVAAPVEQAITAVKGRKVVVLSDKMHEELMYAANRYQNADGVVAYCPRRTEDALFRRGLITYPTGRYDTPPVITVEGWAYLAGKGFQRRAEDKGRLTLGEALIHAYHLNRR